MPSPFVHLEILGPASSVDRWLAVLQEHGGCHLADALHGLEGEAGVGRPSLDEAGLRSEMLASEALGALRGLERLLPAASGGEVPAEGKALRDEALGLAARIRAALERAREAERALRALDAQQAAVSALAGVGETVVHGRAWSLPREDVGADTLARGLRRATPDRVATATGDFETVAVLVPRRGSVPTAVGSPVAPDPVDSAAAQQGASPVAFPAEIRGRPVDEARRTLEALRPDLLRRDRETAASLEARLRQDGPRARRLLEHLEDAEARREARRLLAALEPGSAVSGGVAAARCFVRREDTADLRGRLRRAFGEEVVVRALAEAEDTPALPRRGPASPLGALEGLQAERFGETPPAALLALWLPLVVAAAWADLVGGLLWLVLGGLLGARSPRGVAASARRDIAFLAQVAGLVALVLGILSGRALGAAGEAWLGSDFGLGTRDAAFRPTGNPFRDVLVALGAVALVLALRGLLVALQHTLRGLPARSRQALAGACSYALIAGIAGAALGGAHPLRFGWVLALAALGAGAVFAGRAGVWRTLLDLAATFRLVAVGGAALALFALAGEGLAAPSARTVVLGLGAIVVGCVAVVVDAGQVAMGPPYDAALAGRGLAAPFRPFARRGAGESAQRERA